MKSGVKLLAPLLGIAVFIPVGWAAVNDFSSSADAAGDEPYSSIWVRNVFDLTPKPPPPAPQSTNPPPPNVKLMGIYTLFGKRAILGVQGNSRPGQPPAKEESYTMTEGDRRNGLEVLEIDPGARTVKIKNDGDISTLAIETNTTGHSVAGMAQGAPGGPAPFTAPPRFAAPNMPMSQTPGGVQLPPRGRQFGNAFAPQGAYGQANYYGGAGFGVTAGGAAAGSPAGVSTPGSINAQPAAANNAAQQGTPADNTAQLLQALQEQAAASSGKLYPPPPPPSMLPPSLPPGMQKATGTLAH